MCAKQQLVRSTTIVVLALLLFYGSGRQYVQCGTGRRPQNSTDMLALLDFRQAITSDPRGFFSSWNSSVHYCKWNGVTCSRKHPGRVTVISLVGHGLEGQISPSLGNLTFLEVLNLASNSLFGQIPNLHRLQRLQGLNIAENKLAGSIPSGIGFLSNLKVLNLETNNFTGAIPSSLGNITQLQYLSLSDNQLEGSIPVELGKPSKMYQLSLGGNRLSGSIPPTILNHSSLAFLDLNTNFLCMALPSTIGNTLPSLIGLGLNNNMFHGQIPDSLGNAPHLQSIIFTSNNFTGQVPSSLGNLSFLQTLLLDENKLEASNSKSWEFLDALGNCSHLQVLSIYDNQLQGAIPDSIGKLSPGLQFLALDKNNLSGLVPNSIGNLSGLNSLVLGENNLAGQIGSWVGKLQNLGRLNLEYNNFSGPIPSSIGSFTQLIELYLQSNKFDGLIPPSLGNLALLVLNLSYNNLQGTIPSEVFNTMSPMITCVLSNNRLEGLIPPEVGNLRQLTQLHLSSNRITGEIPDSLGQCQELEEIQIDQNLLAGNIPISLGNLKSLSMLNLSHNNLSGVIPTALADLEFLTHLDLSYNNLKGEIPRNGVFQNATALSLTGNWRLCGGLLNLSMPPCTTVLKTEIQYNMVRVLIPILGFMSIIIVLIAYILILKKKMSNRKHLLMLSFGKRFPKVSYKDLSQATGNFSKSNMIGRGNYGSVYKGKLLQTKIDVAIKVFDLEIQCAEKSFISECEALRSIRHRNLLPILTACSTIDNRGNDFKALISEFMHNGNLDTWLHQKCAGVAPKNLCLVQRINIAIGIAEGLAYLHHDCGGSIVHCDLKPTNILLDNDMNAYLGDFGIASLVLDSRSNEHYGSNSSSAVMGTIGYIAPEYAQSVHVSTCGDVYSFGIVVLEMLIGKRPSDSMFKDELSIVSFVKRNFPDHMLRIIDARLQEECKVFIEEMTETKNEVYQCLMSLVQVALSCTRLFPRERMNMREVAIRLHAIRRSYVGATKPQQGMIS